MTASGWVSAEYESRYCTDCKCGISTLSHNTLSPEARRKFVSIGAQVQFRKASQIVWEQHRIKLSTTWMKTLTVEAGKEANKVRLKLIPERDATEATGVIQVDGALISTTNGWKEVKTAVIGELRPGKTKLNNRRYLSTTSKSSVFEREVKVLARKSGLQPHRMVAMGDGAKWIWKMYGRLFPKCRQLLDFYHCTEHIAKVVKSIWGEHSSMVKPETHHLASRVKRSNSGCKLIQRYIKRHIDNPHIPSRDVNELLVEFKYFKTNGHRMWYKDATAESIPIGTGQVESAHKWIVQSRLKQAGMHWDQTTGRRILALRMIWANNLLERWMREHYGSMGSAPT